MPATSLPLPLQNALTELTQICGATPAPMAGVPGGFEIEVPISHRRMINIEAVQDRFRDREVFVFESTDSSPDGPVRLGVIPTKDRFAVVAAIGTSDRKRGLQSRIVVACLKRIEARQPFVLLTVTPSEIRGRFLGAITDPKVLAEEILKLCPDQGPGHQLAEELRRHRRLELRWE